MAFKADAVGKRLTIPIKRDIFYLVVIDNIQLSSRIRIRIELLLTGRARARDHYGIDNLELSITLPTPLNKEPSVIQLRLRRPRNHHRTSVFLTFRTEV